MAATLEMENGENLFSPEEEGDVAMSSVVSKGHLISPNNEEYDIIVDMIKERLDEGQGETIYEVGTGGVKLFKVSTSLHANHIKQFSY